MESANTTTHALKIKYIYMALLSMAISIIVFLIFVMDINKRNCYIRDITLNTYPDEKPYTIIETYTLNNDTLIIEINGDVTKKYSKLISLDCYYYENGLSLVMPNYLSVCLGGLASWFYHLAMAILFL
jgi:hypothetical protein